MSRELETQIRSYAELIDTELPEFDAGAVLEGPSGPPLVVSLADRTARPASRRWVGALVAAATVAVAGVVGFVVFDADRDPSAVTASEETTDPTPSDPVETTAPPDPPPATTIGPGAWDLAVTIPPDLLDDASPYSSIEEIAGELAALEGVLDVRMVGASVDDWTDLIGPAGADIGCDPVCEGGVVVLAGSVEALESTAGVLSGWTWKVPSEEIHFSPEATRALDAVGASRIDHLATYVETIAGLLGPEPTFDTSRLGIEQILTVASADDVPPGPPEHPFRPQSLVVRAAGTDVGAFVHYPNPDLMLATDALAFTQLTPVGQEATLLLAVFAPGGVTGSGVETGMGFSTEPRRGLGEFELTGEVSWPNGSAFGIGGLPETVAVVAASLPDGTPVWQRPLSGIAVFVWDQPFTFTGGTPPLTGYDAAGNEIFRNG